MMNGCIVKRSYRDDYSGSFGTFDPSSLIFSVQVLQPAFSLLSTTNIYYGYRIHVNYLDYITVLLMEEIPNNHLECIPNPVNNGRNYQPQLVISGFLNHQQHLRGMIVFVCWCTCVIRAWWDFLFVSRPRRH